MTQVHEIVMQHQNISTWTPHKDLAVHQAQSVLTSLMGAGGGKLGDDLFCYWESRKLDL